MGDRSAYWKKYYEARREDKVAYYRANRESVLARQRTYYDAHKEERKEYQKAYYQKRKELRQKEKVWLAEYERECELLAEENSDTASAYTCEDCFYFGAEHEGAFYCALDEAHTHPMDVDSCEACFMRRDGAVAWRSMYEKHKV